MAQIRISDKMIKEFKREEALQDLSNSEIKDLLTKAFNIVQKENFPVRAYFESNSHAELIGLFKDEGIYQCVDKPLDSVAKKHGMILTEGVD